ncbi:MAG TPA: O-antigen ligase family protein [Gaiellaceae bacterium]|nr:O-antigen ligase family protein [Gaiellaceae bacterium]
MSLSDRQSVRLSRLGEVVVTVVVVSLFFERVDYVLYLEHGFPIPNPVFVLAGLLVLAYAAALAYRRRLDLRAPSWAELTVAGLIIVLGLTAVGAALAAAAPTSAGSAGIQSRPIVPQRSGSCHIAGVHAVCRQSPATVRFPKRSIDESSRSSAFYVQLSTTSKTSVPASVVLKQWSPKTEAKPSTATERVTVPPGRGSVPVVVTVKAAAPGPHRLEPSIVLPRVATILIENPQLRTTRPVVFVRHFGQSVKTFIHFAYFALIVLLLGRILTPPLLRRAFSTFFVLAVAASVLAVLQAIDQNALHTGASGALHLVSRSRGGSGFLSPVSIFSEPAFLGYFALLGLLIGLRMYRSWDTRWVLVGMCFCLIAILLAAAAGPIVALGAVALYLAWRANRFWRRFWKELVALVVVAAAVLALLPAGEALTNRAGSVISGSDNSTKFRYAVDSASVRMWKLSPLTGVGLGDARYYLPSLADLSFDPNFTPQSAEFQNVSSYLSTLGESGVFGLLMLATMFITLFWPFGNRRSDDSWFSEAAILMFIVASFFITLFSAPIFWFFVAVRLAELRRPELEPAAAGARVPKSSLQPTVSG